MNPEKLKKLQAQVRIGGKGSVRRKKKVVHRTATTDDKKLQSTLKKLAVNNIPGVEEVREREKSEKKREREKFVYGYGELGEENTFAIFSFGGFLGMGSRCARPAITKHLFHLASNSPPPPLPITALSHRKSAWSCLSSTPMTCTSSSDLAR